jgi:hypothetical protein
MKMEIEISGHGGHLCEAWIKGTGIFEIGETIEQAIGRLVRRYPDKFGVEITIHDCQTTAYDRSDK